MKFLSIAAAVLAFMAATFAPLQQAFAYPGQTIPHTQVEQMQTTVRADGYKYMPRLDIATGCQPYPAVQYGGEVSGGLDHQGGSISSDCNGHGQTQTYYRRQCYSNNGWMCAHMYAWYMPKDQGIFGTGHRHDWEDIVIWVRNNVILSVSYSGHGKYKKYAANSVTFDGTHPRVKYYRNGTHEVDRTTNYGSYRYPIAEWTYMTANARSGLTTKSFGSANVPFKDSNFTRNLARSIFSAHCQYTTLTTESC